jgi:hypothetical protein
VTVSFSRTNCAPELVNIRSRKSTPINYKADAFHKRNVKVKQSVKSFSSGNIPALFVDARHMLKNVDFQYEEQKI